MAQKDNYWIRMNTSTDDRKVLSSVLPGKKPSKPPKHNSLAVSSKIKSKILNTSSFFKVSLKNNNKALALALVAQRERSRQLEMETVQLRKQAESLCFDLAIRRHKHNQLILILKDLQRNTLGHLERVVDLFSDNNDDCEINEGNKRPPDKVESNHIERVEVQMPLFTAKQSQNLSPPKQTSSSSTRQKVVVNDSNNISTNPSKGPPVSDPSKDSMTEVVRPMDNNLKTTQKQTSRQSSSIKDEVEKWSRFYVTGLDPIPALLTSDVSTTNDLQVSGTNEMLDPSDSFQMQTALQPAKKTTVGEAEKTTNNDTEMEITIGDSAAEIVTVETKPKYDGRKKKSNETKTKIPCLLTNVRKKVCVSAGGQMPKVKSTPVNVETLQEIQNASSVTPISTDNPTAGGVDVQHREEDFVENSCKETDLFTARRKTHVTSRSTKHRKPCREAHKTTPDFSNPFDPRKTFTYPLQMESHSRVSNAYNEYDYFDDPETLDSVVKLDRTYLMVVDPAEDISSNSNSLKRDTFVISNETSSKKKTKSQPVMDHKLNIQKNDTFLLPQCSIGEESYSPQGCSDYLDMHTSLSESGHKRCSSRTPGPKSTAKSIKQTSHSSSAVKRRGTFVVSGIRDSCLLNKTISKDGLTENQACPSEDDTVAEEETTVVRDLTGQHMDHCSTSLTKKTQASSKRSWLATQDPGENLQGRESFLVEEMPPWDMDYKVLVAAEQNPKKARREESVKLKKKKKDATKDDPSALVKRRRRKKKIKGCSAKVSPFLGEAFLSSVSLDIQDRTCVPVAAQNTKALPVAEIQVLDYIKQTALEDGTEAPEHLPSLEIRSSEVSSIKPRDNQCLNTIRRDSFVLPNCLNQSNRRRKTLVNSECISKDDDDINCRTSDVYTAKTHTEIADHQSTEAVYDGLKKLLVDKRPPWHSSTEVSCYKPTRFDTSVSNPRSVTSHKVSVFEEEESEVTAEISPADTALKSLINTNWTEDEVTGRTRRRGANVSYKEPPINCKMRRGDKFSDTKFLSSPIYKDKKKKKKKQQNARHNQDHLSHDLF
ncbi:hypothetical protein DPEC_G00044480 [Dallia pectoralis]|uniref:Uncharacterized protein n=1 Tax=Dallia pectoralis TaxID=75939 RepID=A0ACC2HAN4_DALPE|nr:hypothetical protein DPEC_G00044480 [Dallia pectoralis]